MFGGLFFFLGRSLWYARLHAKRHKAAAKKKAADEAHADELFAPMMDADELGSFLGATGELTESSMLSKKPSVEAGQRGSDQRRSSTDGRPRFSLLGFARRGSDAKPSGEEQDLTTSKRKPASRRGSLFGARAADEASSRSARSERRGSALGLADTGIKKIPVIGWKDVTVGRRTSDFAEDADAGGGSQPAAEEPRLAMLAMGEMQLAVIALNIRSVDGGESSKMKRPYMLHSKMVVPSQDMLEELLREATQLRALRHPGLLQMFAAVLDRDGSFGLASELCEAPLAHALAANVQPGAGAASPGLSWRDGMLAIATDVASGLTFLHERGFAHGGLLLDNVMLTGKWQAKLCEFGMNTLRGGRGGIASTLELLSAHGDGIQPATIIFVPPERSSGKFGQQQGVKEVQVVTKQPSRREESMAEASSVCSRLPGRRMSSARTESSVGREGSEASAPDPAMAASSAAEAAAQAEALRLGDVWSFGVLICTLALHQHDQRPRSERKASLLYLGRSNDAGAGAPAAADGDAASASTKAKGEAADAGAAPLKSLKERKKAHQAMMTARVAAAAGGIPSTHDRHSKNLHGLGRLMHLGHHSHRQHRAEHGDERGDGHGDEQGEQHKERGDEHHHHHSRGMNAAARLMHLGHHHGHHKVASEAPPVARTSPRHDSPYLIMLRLCQGKLSPLDGVSLANCPKPLLRIATQCCQTQPKVRPALAALAQELQGPILHLLDPETLEARRPSARLRGWRSAAEAAVLGLRDEAPAVAPIASVDVAAAVLAHDYNAPEHARPAAAAGGKDGTRLKTPLKQSGLAAKSLPSANAVARSLFERFDADGSSDLEAAELRELCASLGREMDEAETRELLELLDTDGSGGVSCDEFLLWWASGLAANGSLRDKVAASRAAAEGSMSSADTVSSPSNSSDRSDVRAAAEPSVRELSVRERVTQRCASEDMHGFHDDTTHEKEGPGRRARWQSAKWKSAKWASSGAPATRPSEAMPQARRMSQSALSAAAAARDEAAEMGDNGMDC